MLPDNCLVSYRVRTETSFDIVQKKKNELSVLTKLYFGVKKIFLIQKNCIGRFGYAKALYRVGFTRAHNRPIVFN